VQWLGRLPGGRKIDRIAANIDLTPAILAACGVRAPAELRLDGVSLWPLLTGEAAEAVPRKLYFQCHRGLSPQRYQNCAVVTQRYKLVGYPGTFSREEFSTSLDHPVLELFDLQRDPGEQHDLAQAHPEIVAELKTAYDAWFDDVRSTRHFTPGVIQIGSDKENPTHLCRYQDASWQGNSPTGWSVEILREGRYRVSVVHEGEAPGSIYLAWQGKTESAPAPGKNPSATFTLAAGQGMMDIWFQANGEDRTLAASNGIQGDAILERLP
jgi:hypothetical protein